MRGAPWVCTLAHMTHPTCAHTSTQDAYAHVNIHGTLMQHTWTHTRVHAHHTCRGTPMDTCIPITSPSPALPPPVFSAGLLHAGLTSPSPGTRHLVTKPLRRRQRASPPHKYSSASVKISSLASWVLSYMELSSAEF